MPISLYLQNIILRERCKYTHFLNKFKIIPAGFNCQYIGKKFDLTSD